MKKAIEKAVFINKPMAIDKGVDRLYFGNEFCENLLPSLKVLKERCAFSKEEGKAFTFVTPFVTERGLNRIRDLFGFLQRQKDVEVVFNDWGVLSLVKDEFRGLTPVLGRLLTRQPRDPRMAKILGGHQRRTVIYKDGQRVVIIPKKIPRSLRDHFKASVINVPFFWKFLSAQGVGRVEIDNLIWGMTIDVPPPVGLSIYYPYGYISTGRMCWKFSLNFKPCRKQCQKYFFEMKDDSLPVPFYGIGGTLFYKYQMLPFKMLKKLKNRGLRVVYQPRLPF